ncbi:MAG: hypothetical protein VX574_02460 [Myxococcota bacterium]|nr:hypothetical protein [Myxococcota bacterium]
MSRGLATALAIAILGIGGCGRYGPPTPVDRLPVAVAEPGAEEGSGVEERESAGSESR